MFTTITGYLIAIPVTTEEEPEAPVITKVHDNQSMQFTMQNKKNIPCHHTVKTGMGPALYCVV